MKVACEQMEQQNIKQFFHTYKQLLVYMMSLHKSSIHQKVLKLALSLTKEMNPETAAKEAIDKVVDLDDFWKLFHAVDVVDSTKEETTDDDRSVESTDYTEGTTDDDRNVESMDYTQETTDDDKNSESMDYTD